MKNSIENSYVSSERRVALTLNQLFGVAGGVVGPVRLLWIFQSAAVGDGMPTLPFPTGEPQTEDGISIAKTPRLRRGDSASAMVPRRTMLGTFRKARTTTAFSKHVMRQSQFYTACSILQLIYMPYRRGTCFAIIFHRTLSNQKEKDNE